MPMKVKQWEDRLKPLLEKEEAHKEFDVHEYGSELLKKFTRTGEVKRFSEVLGNCCDYDVPRYFLSVLMLTNQGNIRIEDYASNPDNAENAEIGMKLRLISLDRHYEVFHDEHGM
ncbi:hypothetical protein AB6A40_005059 [Gnathostoma spinigerum]|uniref:Condensin-2 complex subunit H2 C-terminal domain-containing protein n=1 Tax=Gnathostoma spinigerum TaxID=75299 RepID=A0ABD6EEB9_9BILA